MLLAKFVLLSNTVAEIFLFSLQLLVAWRNGSDFRVVLNDWLISCRNLLSNSHSLFGDLRRLIGFIRVLGLNQLKFLLQTANETLLIVYLCFIITFEGINANIHGFLSSPQIFNNGSEPREITCKVLVRLNFSSISRNNSLSDSLTHSGNLTAFDVLILDLLILSLFSDLSLLSMLLVCWISLSGLDVNLGSCLVNCRLFGSDLFPDGWWEISLLRRLYSFINISSFWDSLSLLDYVFILDRLWVVFLTNWAKILLLIVVTSVWISSVVIRGSVWLDSNLLSFNNISCRRNVSVLLLRNLSSVLLLQSEFGVEVLWWAIIGTPPVHQVIIILSSFRVLVEIVCND